ATAAVPGTADEVQLENDGGNVVYDVEIATANGHVDVKVDPGNGKILAQETEQNDGESADDKGGADKADQADKTDQTKDAADAPTNNGSVAKP
nr:PepSY domain-containing protein [Microthrixaceae bacterium]